jgi:hypothetical protein
VFGASLADDAYVCSDRLVALRIVNDPAIAVLAADQLAERVSDARNELAVKIANVDHEIVRTKQKSAADQEALKSARALAFQAGIRQNLHPAEQAVQDDEAKLTGLNAERQALKVKEDGWAEIAASCKALSTNGKIVVVRVLSASGLALVRIGRGSGEMRVWVPNRFVVKTATPRK